MGTVLSTFTCTDLDSRGSTMDYQLRFHSPPGPTSLCLSDRVLKVPPATIPRPTGKGAWAGKAGEGGGKGLWELRPRGEGDGGGAYLLCGMENWGSG